MCGITGLWAFQAISESELQTNVELMSQAIAHRGPDDSGIWLDPSLGLCLGQRRLSILDLSEAGKQPMQSSSGRFIIVFNGEIYNHISLRKDLESNQGFSVNWKGHSDTETLVEAIEVWGLTDTLKKCHGMFSFAIWDRKEKSLNLVRDRFGEKPLYWGAIDDLGIVFSSELKAIRAMPGFTHKIASSAVINYQQFGFIPAPLCIYEGLEQLMPGHLVRIDRNHKTTKKNELPISSKWWDPEKESNYYSTTFPTETISNDLDVLNELDRVLRKSIKAQSNADVPLGSFLSGGIDSSLITALLQAENNYQVKSFTVSFPEEQLFNEAPFAKAISEKIGTDHTEVCLTAKDAQEIIPDIARHYCEPFADSSQLPTLLLCREARKSGLTVALSGDGGDELFGGYNRYLFAPIIQNRFGKLNPLLRRFIGEIIRRSPAKFMGLNSDGLAQQKLQKLASSIIAAGSIEKLQAVLLTINQNNVNNLISSKPLPKAFSYSEQLMMADILNYLPNDILVKIDRASMAVGLETRAPFLDHLVAEFSWQLPLKYKIRGKGSRSITKWALKELLARYIPRELFERPKAGFAMPIGQWLRGPLKSWANDMLTSELLERHGWFDPHIVRKLWLQHQTGRQDHFPLLWSVLMAQSWLNEWE